MFSDTLSRKLFITSLFACPLVSYVSVQAQQLEQTILVVNSAGEIIAQQPVKEPTNPEEQLRKQNADDSQRIQREAAELQAHMQMQQASAMREKVSAKAQTIEYTEKLDYVVSEKTRTDYAYGNNGSYTTTTSEKIDNQWVYTKKYEDIFNANQTEEHTYQYIWEDGAWKMTSKSAYYYNEQNKTTTQEIYSEINGEWVLTSKYEFNAKGLMIYSESHSYQDGQLTRESYVEFYGSDIGATKSHRFLAYKEGKLDNESNIEYYENGNFKSLFLRSYNAGYEYWSSTTYSIDGKPIESESAGRSSDYDYEKDDYIDYYYKETRKRNNLGDLTMRIWYNWNGREWVLRGKQECTYDEKGRITEDFTYAPEGYGWALIDGIPVMYPDGTVSNSRRIATYRYTYTGYENDKHELIEECNVENLQDGSWRPDPFSYGRAYKRTYNSKGLLVEELKSYYKQTYEYDANDQPLNKYVYTDNNGKWVASEKYLYEFDAQGHKLSEICYQWDNEKYEWKLYRHMKYDENGKETLTISIYGESGNKYEYEYDKFGNTISQIDYTYSNGEWVPTSASESCYDENGKFISTISYSYVDGKKVASYGWKYEYVYDQKDRLTTYIYYNVNADGEWEVNSGYSLVYDEYDNVIENHQIGNYTSVFTYDYNVLAASIYHHDYSVNCFNKLLSEKRTYEDTNEVETFVYHYLPFDLEGISAVETSAQPSEVYDIFGRRAAQNTVHGVFVSNGKKVIR